ncbi:MAG TPA: hypothetical protein VGM78_15960 [Ilumatobacteraceae bacterium]
MATSVLRIIDQRENRFPDQCVVTGVQSDGAVKVWAIESRHVDWWMALLGPASVWAMRVLRREAMQVSLPVTQQRWGIWRRRAVIALVMCCFGAGFVVSGVIAARNGAVSFGVILIVAGMLLRVRSFVYFWVSCELRPKSGDIVVRRAHSGFDAAAKRLYVSSVQRRR